MDRARVSAKPPAAKATTKSIFLAGDLAASCAAAGPASTAMATLTQATKFALGSSIGPPRTIEWRICVAPGMTSITCFLQDKMLYIPATHCRAALACRNDVQGDH